MIHCADPVPDQIKVPTVSLTHQEPFLMHGFKKATGMSDSVRLTVGKVVWSGTGSNHCPKGKE